MFLYFLKISNNDTRKTFKTAIVIKIFFILATILLFADNKCSLQENMLQTHSLTQTDMFFLTTNIIFYHQNIVIHNSK